MILYHVVEASEARIDKGLFTASWSDHVASQISHESTKTSDSSVEGSSNDVSKGWCLSSLFICLLHMPMFPIICTIIVSLISNYFLHVTTADPF